MNTQVIQNKIDDYYKSATPEQVVKELEALGVEFEEVYWEWYWGWDQNDLTKHSEKLKFTDFDDMKTFSSRHSFVSQHLKPNYWSNYELNTATTTES